ncbi:MAG: hypothetical protein HKP14_11205 [Bacteroidia bacterium]|nr:hypothetical protein [Bacteroidia bacterium]
MKKIYILLSLVTILGCQKEFPNPPDYSNELQVELQEKWKYEVPDGELVFWSGADEDKVVFLSRTDADITSYAFDHTGQLLNKYVYTGVVNAKHYLGYHVKSMKGDWIQHSTLGRTSLFNVSTGLFYDYLEDNEYIRDSITSHFLASKGICYYQKLDNQSNLLVYQLNLATNTSIIYDTLEQKHDDFLTNYHCIGEFKNPTNARDGAYTLIFNKLSYERFNSVWRVSIVGLALDEVGRKDQWVADNLFFTSAFIRPPKKYIIEGRYLYAFQDNMLQCVDILSRKLNWEKLFSNGSSSNLAMVDNNLVLTEGEKNTMVLNKNTGATIWSKGYGYYPYQIAASQDYVSLISYREYGDGWDYATQLHVIDIRNGRELVRTHNPINPDGEIAKDELDGGLCKSVSNKGNTLYCANKEYFMGLEVVEK